MPLPNSAILRQKLGKPAFDQLTALVQAMIDASIAGAITTEIDAKIAAFAATLPDPSLPWPTPPAP